MPPPKPRQIKKPRLSLSCTVCRRRKVRCGRELPECANCIRMKKNCAYNTTVRDEFTGQVHQVSPAPQDRESNGSNPHTNHSNSQPVNPTWFHWVAREENATDPSDMTPRERVVQTGSGDSNPLSGTPRLARSTQHRQSFELPYQKVPSCQETTQVSGDHNNPAPERGGDTLRATQDSSAVASMPSASLDYGGSLCCDYLSLRQGARSRYIGPAFWGFVAGKASKARKMQTDSLT